MLLEEEILITPHGKFRTSTEVELIRLDEEDRAEALGEQFLKDIAGEPRCPTCGIRPARSPPFMLYAIEIEGDMESKCTCCVRCEANCAKKV